LIDGCLGELFSQHDGSGVEIKLKQNNKGESRNAQENNIASTFDEETTILQVVDSVHSELPVQQNIIHGR
jgi:hypothetical protein